jgi:hypothetical protein
LVEWCGDRDFFETGKTESEKEADENIQRAKK